MKELCFTFGFKQIKILNPLLGDEETTAEALSMIWGENSCSPLHNLTTLLSLIRALEDKSSSSKASNGPPPAESPFVNRAPWFHADVASVVHAPRSNRG